MRGESIHITQYLEISLIKVLNVKKESCNYLREGHSGRRNRKFKASKLRACVARAWGTARMTSTATPEWTMAQVVRDGVYWTVEGPYPSDHTPRTVAGSQ